MCGVTQQELLDACKQAKKNANGLRSVAEGWTVKAERVYNTPRGGPMSAWKWIYFLLSPINEKFGGYGRMDSFASWGSNFIWRAGQ